jgi:outer membrane biosynthesis protein TonB
MRRLVTKAWPLAVVLGLGNAGLYAQEEKPATPPAEEAKPQEPTPAPAPAETPAPAPAESTAPAEIPAEVQAKLDAAYKAIAEAIAAAEKAGLVKSNVSPPPILDILFRGKATDATDVEAVKNSEKEVGLSPEAFAAYFTGYASAEGIVPQTNIKIFQPSKGLKELYDKRSSTLTPYLEEARKALGVTPAAPAEAPAPAAEEPKPADAPKEEAKPTEEAPKEGEKPAEEAPKEGEKPAEEAPKEEPKPAEAPKEGEKPAEEPKPEA